MNAFVNMIKFFGVSIICFCLALFGILGTYFTFRNLDDKIENGDNVKITEISSMNDEPLAYVATYIIPIMFNDYSNITNNITIFFGDEARTLITAGCITVYTGVSCCTLALANCTCWATWLNTV